MLRLNATNRILKVASYFQDDFLEDQGRLYSQANYTKDRVDRIGTMLNGEMRTVLGTVLSLNNKIDEFIFLRNATETPIYVFNATEQGTENQNGTQPF